jgi:phytoene dehydrogenase-like protein
MKPSHIFALQCLLAQHSLAQTSGDTLQRDVVIIGAGSSGSYAAVRLHQMGKSVALVEKANRAGGHTNTYKDPATGQTFDYGTQILVNTTVVTDFFNSLNIPLAPYAPQATGVATDCKRGVPGPPLPVVSPEDSAAALERYKTELAKYPDMFRGYNLPDPVPDDLLLPWGDFLAKYDLGALAYDAWLQFQGMGNILAQPTLYIMKLFNPMQVDARENHRKVAEANHNMQALCTTLFRPRIFKPS